jgi:hypothetical protein
MENGPSVASGSAPLAPAAQPAKVAGPRPFEARFDEHVVSRTDIDPQHFREQQAGSGTATHLGQTSLSASLEVDETPFPTTGCVSVSFTGTLVAANGDELRFTKTGSVCPQKDGSLPGHFQFSFTGGTGRFQGATGSGTVEGNNVNGAIVETWTGTISF